MGSLGGFLRSRIAGRPNWLYGFCTEWPLRPTSPGRTLASVSKKIRPLHPVGTARLATERCHAGLVRKSAADRAIP
jgi:hypothetical protein